MKGANVGGIHYNNLRCADDTALLTGNEKELSELTSKINEVGKQFGTKINTKKTNGCRRENKYTQNKYCRRWTTYRTSNIIYVYWDLNNCMRMGDPKRRSSEE